MVALKIPGVCRKTVRILFIRIYVKKKTNQKTTTEKNSSKQPFPFKTKKQEQNKAAALPHTNPT